MKSIEILRNCGGSADKGCGPKLLLLGWILHQSMRNSFLGFFGKILKPYENIASGKMVVESLQCKALAKS